VKKHNKSRKIRILNSSDYNFDKTKTVESYYGRYKFFIPINLFPRCMQQKNIRLTHTYNKQV